MRPHFLQSLHRWDCGHPAHMSRMQIWVTKVRYHQKLPTRDADRLPLKGTREGKAKVLSKHGWQSRRANGRHIVWPYLNSVQGKPSRWSFHLPSLFGYPKKSKGFAKKLSLIASLAQKNGRGEQGEGRSSSLDFFKIKTLTWRHWAKILEFSWLPAPVLWRTHEKNGSNPRVPAVAIEHCNLMET